MSIDNEQKTKENGKRLNSYCVTVLTCLAFLTVAMLACVLYIVSSYKKEQQDVQVTIEPVQPITYESESESESESTSESGSEFESEPTSAVTEDVYVEEQTEPGDSTYYSTEVDYFINEDDFRAAIPADRLEIFQNSIPATLPEEFTDLTFIEYTDDEIKVESSLADIRIYFIPDRNIYGYELTYK